MKNHDGATVLGIVEGRSTRDPDNPANAEINVSKTFETGDDRFKWMNNEVFGKKLLLLDPFFVYLHEHLVE